MTPTTRPWPYLPLSPAFHTFFWQHSHFLTSAFAFYCSILTTLPLGEFSAYICLPSSELLKHMVTFTYFVLIYSVTYLPIYICLHLSTFLHSFTWGPWQTFTNSLTICVKLYVMCRCAFSRNWVCDFHYCFTGAFDCKVVKNYSIKAIPEK